jgi:hypothetical protein
VFQSPTQPSVCETPVYVKRVDPSALPFSLSSHRYNPVYVKRVDPSALPFSLSSPYRRSYICLVLDLALSIHNKQQCEKLVLALSLNNKQFSRAPC